MAQRVRTIARNGKSIFLLDLSGTRPAEAVEALRVAQERISVTAPHSVLFLTDVRDAVYDRDSSAALKEFAQRNTPHIRASAVVGAEGLRGVLLTSVRVVTGREIELFGTTEEAEEWLASR
jgi:hypothetical protein